IFVSSYSDLARILDKHSASPAADVKMLFRHMVFNAAIGNVDDHLKNFWMLATPSGYSLAPAFDLVPDTADRVEHTLSFRYQFGCPTAGELLEVASEWEVANARNPRAGRDYRGPVRHDSAPARSGRRSGPGENPGRHFPAAATHRAAICLIASSLASPSVSHRRSCPAAAWPVPRAEAYRRRVRPMARHSKERVPAVAPQSCWQAESRQTHSGPADTTVPSDRSPRRPHIRQQSKSNSPAS